MSKMGARPKYDWEDILRVRKRKLLTLKYKVDFDCLPSSMAMMIRQRASERGISVKTKIHRELQDIEVQVMG